MSMAENSVRPAGTTYQAPMIQVMGLLADLTAGSSLPTGPKTPSATSDYIIQTAGGGHFSSGLGNLS